MSLRQLLRDCDAGLKAWWPYLRVIGILFVSVIGGASAPALFMITMLCHTEGGCPVFVAAPWNYISDNTGITIAAACLAFVAMLGAMTLSGRRVRRRREAAIERAKSAPASQSQRPKPSVKRPVTTAAGAAPSANRNANPRRQATPGLRDFLSGDPADAITPEVYQAIRQNRGRVEDRNGSS